MEGNLHKAANELLNLMPLSDYLEVLADGIYRSHEWNVGASNSRGEEFEDENVATDKALQHVWTGLQLMVGLTRMHEALEDDKATLRKKEIDKSSSHQD